MNGNNCLQPSGKNASDAPLIKPPGVTLKELTDFRTRAADLFAGRYAALKVERKHPIHHRVEL